MNPIFAAIADDFTGATDLAGLLARSGAPVSLRIGIPEEDVCSSAPFEVIALKSRTAPVGEAVAEARTALQWLKNAGFQRFFWKYCSTFDSTPLGNIGPVSEALMADLDVTQTIYCPAFPENGRSVYMGELFVGRVPLAESPMKDHPLTPMRDSNLLRLLEPQVTKPVGLLDRSAVAKGPDFMKQTLEKMAAEGIVHVVVDAVASEDLTTIAEACSHMPLVTGGSAVAMPLPDIYARSGLPWEKVSNHLPALPNNNAIVLSGSCSEMTRSQVAHYLTKAPSYQLAPLILAEKGPQDALEWLNGQSLKDAPMFYATADPKDVRHAQQKLGVAQAGAIIENTLGQIAISARERGACRFVVAGGETSGTVTKVLGVTQLDIGREISPGVPWTFGQSESIDIALALKSGNFGEQTFFCDALSELEKS